MTDLDPRKASCSDGNCPRSMRLWSGQYGGRKCSTTRSPGVNDVVVEDEVKAASPWALGNELLEEQPVQVLLESSTSARKRCCAPSPAPRHPRIGLGGHYSCSRIRLFAPRVSAPGTGRCDTRLSARTRKPFSPSWSSEPTARACPASSSPSHPLAGEPGRNDSACHELHRIPDATPRPARRSDR